MNTKRKKPTRRKSHNDPLDIKDHLTDPKVAEAKVAPEIVADYEEIEQVSVPKQSAEQLRPFMFQPGQSGNPSGRSPDFVKAIGLRIAQLKVGKVLKEKELDKLKRLGLDTADMTVLESLIIDWAISKNPAKQQMYLERIAGKVPNINLNAEISAGLVTRFKSKLTDSELEAIANGADAMDILFDKLPDIDTDDVIDADAE